MSGFRGRSKELRRPPQRRAVEFQAREAVVRCGLESRLPLPFCAVAEPAVMPGSRGSSAPTEPFEIDVDRAARAHRHDLDAVGSLPVDDAVPPDP